MRSYRQAKGKKHASRARSEDAEMLAAMTQDKPAVFKPTQTPIVPMNENQRSYIAAIRKATLTFATGPAGVGKTWICGALAAEFMSKKRIDKIIVTRPAVEAGENLGFLPGEIEEKYAPYLVPFKDVLVERLGIGFYDYCIKGEKIEAAPLAYMRGRTFKNAFVILDEAQNVTPLQMKMFLTRIGENCIVVVNGDLGQKDIHGPSGLSDAILKLEHLEAVRVVEFERQDVVRSGLVQDIVEAYETSRR